MDRTTPVTPALLPAQGRQRHGMRQSDPPPYRPPPAAQTGGTAHGPPPTPPPQPAPRQTNATGPPHGGRRAPSQVAVRPPPDPAGRSPHRACRPRGQCRAPTPTRLRPQHVGSGPPCPSPDCPPSGRAVGGGGAPDPRRPSQQWKAPPPGTPFCHPHNPKPSRGEPGPDRPPRSTPDGARDRGRTRGGARTTWNGPTSAQCRDRARCARHTIQGGGGSGRRGSASAHTRKWARGDYQKGNRTKLAERTDRVKPCTSERG